MQMGLFKTLAGTTLRELAMSVGYLTYNQKNSKIRFGLFSTVPIFRLVGCHFNDLIFFPLSGSSTPQNSGMSSLHLS